MFVCGRDQSVPELRGIFLNVSIATKQILELQHEFKESEQNSFQNSLILPQ